MDEIGRIVEILKTKGYGLVCATNPIFPSPRSKLDSVGSALISRTSYWSPAMKRCTSANLTSITTETLRKIDRRPDECIMAGNDVEEGHRGLPAWMRPTS